MIYFRFNPILLIYLVAIGTPLLFTTTYIIAAYEGHVPWGIPFIQGCTYITDTGIRPIESYIFRSGLISIMVIIGIIFYFFCEWLILISEGAAKKIAFVSFYIAILACLCLNISVLQGTAETLMGVHRIFAKTFFILLFISQVIYTIGDYKYRMIENKYALGVRVIAVFIQIITISLNLLSLIIPAISTPAYEWLMVVFLLAWFWSFVFDNTIFNDQTVQLREIKKYIKQRINVFTILKKFKYFKK